MGGWEEGEGRKKRKYHCVLLTVMRASALSFEKKKNQIISKEKQILAEY